MAGGPVFPSSAVPVTAGKVFPNIYVGGGANSKHDDGLGVMASLDADADWALRFQMPPSLPSGTGKLRLLALANASTGNAIVSPRSLSVAVGSSPSAASLTTETSDPFTLTWTAVDTYHELKVTLASSKFVASQVLVMRLRFNTTSWTLAQVSTWQPSIIWE